MRVDTGAGLPGRFVSGIHVDRDNANRAVLSYSGYSAYKAGGHVFDVVFNGTSALSSVTDLSYDLGDQPILDIVKDRITGSLFAGTDFGVVELAAGSTTWVASPGLPKVATYGLTLGPKDHVLYAATHGRGIWRVKVA